MKDSYFHRMMMAAIEEARIAGSYGEVPVGAVVARDGQMISRAHNRRENQQNAVLHAEIEAIQLACYQLGSWRLSGCDLFVTLEPCPMCAGAAINSRVDRVIFGAFDLKAGCCGSVVNLFAYPFNHRPELFAGICESDCTNLLTEFFGNLRK